jgi:hypothetical protein
LNGGRGLSSTTLPLLLSKSDPNRPLSTMLAVNALSLELFGRPSPKISDFENPSDSDSACLLVYAFIL